MTENEHEIELEPMNGSELPLVTRDETPPLMLDLPDGQQLVVGKLPDGIVIEIATWRGTGRPDSRTNRMMLGVSYDDEETLEEKNKKQFFRARKRTATERSGSESEVALPTEVPAIEIAAAAVEAPVLALEEKEVKIIASEVPDLEAVVAIDDEHPHVVVIEHKEEVPVPAASTTRNMQDLFGARPRTQVTFDRETSTFDSKAHEIVKKEKSKREISISPKKLIRWVGYPAAVALVIFLIFGPGKFSITHPVKGVNTSLSSAKNALVIVKAAESYAVGDNVVANVEEGDSPAVFGSIAATSDTEYVLTENNLYHSALKGEVKGKVVLVMPGLGYLAGLIGF